MSVREEWVEARFHYHARNMPDEFPDGFARHLAEAEWEEKVRREIGESASYQTARNTVHNEQGAKLGKVLVAALAILFGAVVFTAYILGVRQ